MSRVADIYANLAARVVQYDGADVPVYGLERQPATVQAANLPARLLLSGRATDAAFGFIAIGNIASVRWTVLDLLLVAPTTLGQSKVISAALPILEYCGAYAEMLRGFRDAGLPGAQIILEDCRIDPGVYTYPAGADAAYYGVLATLTFKEILSR